MYNIIVRARKRLGTLFQYMRFETKYAHPSFHSSPVHPYVVIVLGTKQRWKFIYNIPIVYFLRLLYRYLQYEQVNNIVPVIHILKKQEQRLLEFRLQRQNQQFQQKMWKFVPTRTTYLYISLAVSSVPASLFPLSSKKTSISLVSKLYYNRPT